ncbi:MAG: M48 family metallopeptidase [Myxococcota bacterium]|nr:M48 family metallopeptidase [Myxococcota bacterium]
MKWTTAILSLALATGCATSPTGRKQLILVPDDQMDQLGAQAFTEIQKETPVTKNGQAMQYVSCIAKSITSVLPKEYQGAWDVKVFESEQVNAFALPGKKIGVFTGLLKVAVNQDQVATVMGHEVGHVLARHGNERVSQNVILQSGLSVVDAFVGGSATQRNLIMGALGVGAQFGVVLPHGRTQESEADRIGLELMAAAGFDPKESVDLWQNMGKASGGQEPPEWMSTHPANASRIAGLQEHMAMAEGERAKAKAAGRVPQCGSAGIAAN